MNASSSAPSRVGPPTLFHPLPTREGDVEAAVAAIAVDCGVGDRLRPRLEAELSSAVEYARRRSSAAGRAWALVGQPRTGNVDAIMLVETYSRAEGLGPREYLERCRATAQNIDPEDLWQFDVDYVTVAGREAVILHQLEMPAGDEGRPATEQATVAHFVDDSTMIEYRLVTQDLAVFDDIVSFTAGLAASIAESREA